MERQLLTNDWFSVSLLLILSTLIILKLSNKGKFARLVSLDYIDYYWLLNNRDRHFLTYFEFVIFLLAHLIFAQFLVVFFGENLGLFLNVEFSGMQLVIVLSCIVVVISFAKFYLERVLNFTINRQPLVVFFIFYKQFVWTYGLFVAHPFLILHEYLQMDSSIFKYTALSVFFIFSLYHLLRFGYKNRSYILKNWYYFILYICTLEIVPYFLIYKLFILK